MSTDPVVRCRHSSGLVLHASPSREFTLAEVLMVVVIMGTLFVITVPKITALYARTSLGATHEMLESAFATACAFAMQKGKRATLTLSGNTVGGN